MTSFKHFSSYLLPLWLFTLPYQEGVNAQTLPQNAAVPAPAPPVFITPTTPVPLNSPVRQALEQANATQSNPRAIREISLNFNNVPIIEYIRYVSRLAQQNFIFDQDELQFNITVVSEDPVSIDDLMATLLQELRVRDLFILEQGGNLIIYRNPRIKTPARIISGGTEPISTQKSEIVTRVFELNTLDPLKASEVIRPLLSDDISVEVLRDTNKLIVTDFVDNINSIAELLNNLDAPNSGIQIGQYTVRNAFAESLAELAMQIIQPIAQGNPFTLVPHSATNSIYVVSNDYIVQKIIAILQNLDVNEGRTKILTLERLNMQHGPGVTSQGAFKKEEDRGPAGALGSQGAPPPIVGPGGESLPPGQATSYPFEGAGGARVEAAPAPYGAAGATVGAAPAPYGAVGARGGAAPAPYGAAGKLGREGRVPQGTPPAYPAGRLGSQGQFLPPGAAQGPNGRPSFRYTGAPQGTISSEGYYAEGEPQYPYGMLGSEGLPGEYFEGPPELLPGELTSSPQWLRNLPRGEIEQTVIFKYAVKHNKAEDLAALLQQTSANSARSGDLQFAAVLRTARPIADLNAIIFVGAPDEIERTHELIESLDTPPHQVFIEALVLEVDYLDSLSLSVDWATSFGGGNTNGVQAYQSASNVLGQVLSTTNLTTTPPTLPVFPTKQLAFPAYSAGVIGTHLTHHGMHFSTFGSFVQAVQSNSKVDILASPRVITIDNNFAELYNGSVDRYKTQSIPNDLGTLITNNYEYLDVGLTLRVRPLVTENRIITLDVFEERTAPTPLLTNFFTSNSTSANDFNLVPVLTKERTIAKIHLPDGFFTVLSGILSDTDQRQVNQIPCLGGIPIIGAVCKDKSTTSTKQNVMLFIRAMIVDGRDDLEDLTKRQQDVYCEKSKHRRSWNYEIDEGLDHFNIKPADPDEIGCGGCNQ